MDGSPDGRFTGLLCVWRSFSYRVDGQPGMESAVEKEVTVFKLHALHARTVMVANDTRQGDSRYRRPLDWEPWTLPEGLDEVISPSK